MRTKLNPTKLHAVARFAQFCVSNPDLLTDTLISQTLGIAIRKLHDFGECRLGNGKYLGHPAWSRNARALLDANADKMRGITKHLAHEHVIPVSVVVGELKALPRTASISRFEDTIRNLSLVAIITRKEEAEQLRPVTLADAPERWFVTDPWWRYRKAGLLSKMVDDAGKPIDQTTRRR